MKIFRARVANAASDGATFRGVPPPPSIAAYDGNMTLTPATPAQPQQQIPNPRRQSLALPILAVVGLLALAVVILGVLFGLVLPSTSNMAVALPSSIPNDTDWARIQAARKITVGTTADYPPFSSRGKNSAWDGFDIQLMSEIGKRLGLQVSYVDIPFEGLAGALRLPIPFVANSES